MTSGNSSKSAITPLATPTQSEWRDRALETETGIGKEDHLRKTMVEMTEEVLIALLVEMAMMIVEETTGLLFATIEDRHEQSEMKVSPPKSAAQPQKALYQFQSAGDPEPPGT